MAPSGAITAFPVHTIFDFLAWLSGGLMAWWIARRGFLGGNLRAPLRNPGYFVALGLGAIAGALTFGSLNIGLTGTWELGHSIAGAIAGGIVTVEGYKLATGIRGSTGVQFVAPLAIGIAVGRLGCFFAGLPDYTYGTPTSLSWGVDFGDGIPRHPVQLYESAAMLVFLAVFLRGIATGQKLFLRQGFYLFTAWYGLQRFAWEFLKPYPKIAGPFNLFHAICALLIAYSLLMMRGNRELRAAA